MTIATGANACSSRGKEKEAIPAVASFEILIPLIYYGCLTVFI